MASIEKKPGGLTRSELIKEISKDTMIKPDIVDMVLSRFSDIAIEQLVNSETFVLNGIFVVAPYEVKAGIDPNGDPLPPQRRIRLRMSKNLKALYRLQHDLFSDKPYFVNRDNWKGALKWVIEGNAKPMKERASTIASNNNLDNYYNPLLDEED